MDNSLSKKIDGQMFEKIALFGANNLVKFGMKIYIFVLLVLSVVLIEKREGNLC